MSILKKWKEGIFSFFRGSKFDKLEKLMKKLDIAYNKLVAEAGGEANLSNGARLGYDNFGDFVDISCEIIEIIKEDLEENSRRREDVPQYKDILLRLQDKLNKVNYVRGVSELSVSQLKFVKRNVPNILNWFG